MSFREVIAGALNGDMGNHYSRYGNYTIGVADLSKDVVAFLKGWMESDDPSLRAHTGYEGFIVAGAIEEFLIAMAGKTHIVDVHKRQTNARIAELHRLAGEAEKISKELQQIAASGEIVITLGMERPEGPRPPKLSFDEMASVHRESAVILRAVARDCKAVPTTQAGADVWGRGQFMRGMVDAILFSKYYGWDPDQPAPELDGPDYELVAALAHLIFDKAYPAKDVRQAMNTDRSSRGSKVLNRKRNTFRKKSDIV
jgi:hypothetical protein